EPTGAARPRRAVARGQDVLGPGRGRERHADAIRFARRRRVQRQVLAAHAPGQRLAPRIPALRRVRHAPRTGPARDRVGPRRRLDARVPLRALGALERRRRVAPDRLEPRAVGVLLRGARGRRGDVGAPRRELSSGHRAALTRPTPTFYQSVTQSTESVDNAVEKDLKQGTRAASVARLVALVK